MSEHWEDRLHRERDEARAERDALRADNEGLRGELKRKWQAWENTHRKADMQALMTALADVAKLDHADLRLRVAFQRRQLHHAEQSFIGFEKRRQELGKRCHEQWRRAEAAEAEAANWKQTSQDWHARVRELEAQGVEWVTRCEAAEAEVAALRGEREWKAIETAPVLPGMSALLLWDGKEVFMGCRTWDEGHPSGWYRFGRNAEQYPTHWMALPEGVQDGR